MGIRVFVAGQSGQVAQSLAKTAPSQVVLGLHGRPDVDITDKDSIARAVEAFNPDVVINAAAYTAVDQAEDERDAAFAANEAGPRHLADVTADRGIPLIHLSTDYVFDGSGTRPYREDDPTAPLGVYGASKLAGEEAVVAANPKHIIARTAWVYGSTGKNFLKTMLRVAASNDELRVVDDQRGAPTSSDTIAVALLTIAQSIVEAGDQAPFGLYHLVSAGEASWADFAKAIFDESAARGGPSASVVPITTAEYPTKATRPAYSVLDTAKTRSAFDVILADWREPVGTIVTDVLNEGAQS
ncbi:MAG: dTDP-4-dehydrorhamnose reductase [Pseudomonadota bacterium]